MRDSGSVENQPVRFQFKDREVILQSIIDLPANLCRVCAQPQKPISSTEPVCQRCYDWFRSASGVSTTT